MSEVGTTLVTVEHLSKTFGTSRVLDDVSVSISAGEVCAVLGQNGSGKSTLVKLLAGIHQQDPGGTIACTDGTELHFIHQDLGMVNELSTVENLDLSRTLTIRDALVAGRKAERRKAEELVARFGGTFDVDQPVSKLSPAERTIAAIARALAGWSHPKNVLVLDEPTAALHGREVDTLFDTVRRVAAEGAGVLFITHHLDEVFAIADRAVFLRDGRLVADRPVDGLDERELVEIITGGAVPQPARRVHERGGLALRARGLRGESVIEMDIGVHAGEILGIGGLLGSGRDEVLKLIFGAGRGREGTVEVGETLVRRGSVRAATRAGIGLVPGDRPADGAFTEMEVCENLTLPRLQDFRGRSGRLNRRAEARETLTWIRRLDVRPPDPRRRLGLLSGGNQQKVMLARWLRLRPSVLLLEDPTQGVDVGAKAAIHHCIHQAAADGRGVIVSSSDARELVELCDRVIVMRDGLAVENLAEDGLTEEALLSACLGFVKGANNAQEPTHV